jgi:hypothetical protein
MPKVNLLVTLLSSVMRMYRQYQIVENMAHMILEFDRLLTLHPNEIIASQRVMDGNVESVKDRKWTFRIYVLPSSVY